MEILTAERKFTVEATRERVWDLLGRAIFDSLQGLEKMKVIDENNFRAELKTRAFGIPLTMYLRGEMTDILPPETISVRLAVRSKWNLISLVQRVTFTSNSAGEGKTEVVCKALAEDLNPLFRGALLGQVKSQANQILACIEERLKQLA